MSKSEIRKDYFKDEYVIFAPNRVKFLEKFKDINTVENRTCPFCPENMKNETIAYKDDNYNGDWEIISILNKFAVLTMDNEMAFGQAEVIVETRKHGMDINDFSIDHIVRIFNAYIDRFMTLRNVDGIKHVIIFKNEGGKAGASIVHTHSQVIALPILPTKTKAEAQAYNKYRLEKVTCPYCDVLAKEADKLRVIWQDENVLALSPYASESPYGVWLLPKRHMSLFGDMTRSEKESLAFALKIILGKLDEYGINYNYFVENSVNNEDYHTHIKIAPRPNVWAGLELGTGIMINPVMPEFAAKFYRGEIQIGNDSKS